VPSCNAQEEKGLPDIVETGFFLDYLIFLHSHQSNKKNQSILRIPAS
jgi:hypothetical protein